MTEPLGLRQHIRFGDEIASKVDLIDENKEVAQLKHSNKGSVGRNLSPNEKLNSTQKASAYKL